MLAKQKINQYNMSIAVVNVVVHVDTSANLPYAVSVSDKTLKTATYLELH